MLKNLDVLSGKCGKWKLYAIGIDGRRRSLFPEVRSEGGG